MIRIITLISFLTLNTLYAQVGINTENPDPSAALDVSSSQGGLLIPRMTKAQIDAIVSPATGLIVYQMDTIEGFYYYRNGWIAISEQITLDDMKQELFNLVVQNQNELDSLEEEINENVKLILYQQNQLNNYLSMMDSVYMYLDQINNINNDLSNKIDSLKLDLEANDISDKLDSLVLDLEANDILTNIYDFERALLAAAGKDYFVLYKSLVTDAFNSASFNDGMFGQTSRTYEDCYACIDTAACNYNPTFDSLYIASRKEFVLDDMDTWYSSFGIYREGLGLCDYANELIESCLCSKEWIQNQGEPNYYGTGSGSRTPIPFVCSEGIALAGHSTGSATYEVVYPCNVAQKGIYINSTGSSTINIYIPKTMNKFTLEITTGSSTANIYYNSNFTTVEFIKKVTTASASANLYDVSLEGGPMDVEGLNNKTNCF